MKLLGLAIAAIAASALGATWSNRQPALGLREGPAPTTISAGPRPLRAPAGATIAQDEQALGRLLADPHGPSEIWLGSRTYRGDWTIGRKLALRGETGATLLGTGNDTVLTVEAEGVQIDNLVVQHSGRRHTREDAGIKAKAPRVAIRHVLVKDTLFGVSLGPCTGCVLERSDIRGSAVDHELAGDAIKLWEADDAVVRDCVVDRTRDLVVWYSHGVVLEGNRVTNSRYGTHFMHASDTLVRRSQFVDNVVGVFVMYSARVRVEQNLLAGARGAAGIGIGFKESDDVVVDGNWMIANTLGTYLDRTPRSSLTSARFEHNLFSLNATAMRLHSSEEGLEFSGNTLLNNREAVEVEGGGDALGTRFVGNYWSDYAGYDLDRDGTGDVAHEVQRLSSSLFQEHPTLSLFDGSLSVGLVDMIARALPVFATDRLLVDEKPRFSARGGERDPH